MNNILRLLFIMLFFSLSTSLFAQEKCQFSYDAEKTTLEWTAFKFTEKTGVKGTIQKIEVQNTKRADSVLGALKDMTFTAFTDTVNSNNPDRDAKIRTYFFGSAKNGTEIKGKFSNIVMGKNSGSASLDLDFNKLKHSYPVTFEITDQTLTLVGTIDVIAIGLGEGIQKLNEVCSDLHKGTDGKSKLWPTVDIKVTSTLSKKCEP